MFEFRSNPKPHQCAVKFCRRNRAPKGGGLCARHSKQKWRMNHPVISAWRMLIDNAKRRRKEFALSTQDFIDFIEETAYLDNKGIWRLCYHIDRIDHTKGYVPGNIQMMTCSENSAKGNFERWSSNSPF